MGEAEEPQTSWELIIANTEGLDWNRGWRTEGTSPRVFLFLGKKELFKATVFKLKYWS